MKNKILKIIIIITSLIPLLTITSNANNINIKTNESEVKAGNEFTIKIETDKKLDTTTFYLKYDNEKVKFIECLSENVSFKDYPDDGILRIVYFDLTKQGIDELLFKFKAKNNKYDNVDFELTNLTAQFMDDATVFNEKNLEQSEFKTTITIKRSYNFYSTIGIIIGIFLMIMILITFIVIRKKRKKN